MAQRYEERAQRICEWAWKVRLAVLLVLLVLLPELLLPELLVAAHPTTDISTSKRIPELSILH